MKHYSIDPTKGEQALPGCVAVAIAQSSETDLVQVGARTLGPGALLLQPGNIVLPVRGFRAEDEADVPPLAPSIDLLLYEACDVIVPPGPRSPRSYPFSGELAGAGLANAVLVARVPFMGRKQASLAVKRPNGEIDDFGIVVRGVRYLTRERIRDAPTQEPFFGEPFEATWFDGRGSAPESVIGGGATLLSLVAYIGGGGDLQELAWDELEFWAHGIAGRIDGQVEVSGERG